MEGRGEKGQEKKTRIQLGLAVSFSFVFYLGYYYNKLLLLETVKGPTVGLLIYAGLGFAIIILAIVSLLL